MNICIYWGCNNGPGHFLIYPSGLKIRDFEADQMMIPRDYQLDATFLFLPRPEKVGYGAITYLPATNRTILAWWGNPFDTRPGVNSAIIVSGKITSEECWHQFSQTYKELATKLTKPKIINELS